MFWLFDDVEVVWDLVIVWVSGEELFLFVVLVDDVDVFVVSFLFDYG